MSRNSVLKGVIRLETQFTMMLRNLMAEHAELRECVLEHLVGDGYAELKNRSVELRCERPIRVPPETLGEEDRVRLDLTALWGERILVVEVKTGEKTGLTKGQRSGGYERYVKACGGYLAYLVPRDWTGCEEVRNKFRNHENCRIVTWQQMLPKLETIALSAQEGSVLREFVRLLKNKFRAVYFSREEVEILESPELPIPELLKVVGLLSAVAKLFNTTAAGDEQEFGFSVEKKLYVGLWSGYWNAMGRRLGRPLCFAIGQPSNREAAAFQEGVSRLGLGTAIDWVEEDTRWLVAAVPSEWMQGTEAAASIVQNLRTVLDELRIVQA